jgi:hypothetical protein
MIIIELEGVEYQMPQSWEEVTLEMFEKIVDLAAVFVDYKSRYQYSIEMLSILTGAPQEGLSKMTKKSFEELATACEWASTEVINTRKMEYVIDGEEYMAIQNLDSLEMGDMVSMELLIGNTEVSKLLTNLLPILIRRVKVINRGGKEVKVPGPFVAEEYEETKEIFRKNLSVADVNHLKDFF